MVLDYTTATRDRSRMFGIQVLASVLLLLATLACSSGGTPDPGLELAAQSGPSGEQPLMPGDALRVSFSRDTQLNGQYTIDETGVASLPLLGARTLTDRPAAQVKGDLVREYGERTRNQSVQVVYLRRVRVLGEVRNPGLHLIDPTMTFDDVIAVAGGATNDGNLRNVTLVRDGEEIVEGLDVRTTVAASVYSGDQIYVPKTSWFSRNGAVLLGATISAIGVIVAFSN